MMQPQQQQHSDAKVLLGLAPNSRPSQSQVKDAYRRKVWETHPDRFPAHQKAQAECKFKLLIENDPSSVVFINADLGSLHFVELCRWAAAKCAIRAAAAASYYSRVVVKNGASGGGRAQTCMRSVASVPFLFIIFGALTLAGSTASRAYKTQKEAHPSFNPFLP